MLLWYGMDIGISEAYGFLTSTIGILLSSVLLIGALIPGAKYLNRKLDERIDNNINKKVDPLIQGLCNQVTALSGALKEHKASTDSTLAALDDATKFLQDLISNK